jgi:Fe/S biogenesis protein NfuA
VDVTGVRDGVFTYDIFFQVLTDAAQADVVQHDDELPVVVTARSIDQVRGARLDWSADDGGGLVILNPNTPPSDNRLPGPRGDVSGDLALRVIAVLDEQINPSIAAHGGRADLVGLQEGIAYLQLSGGCQGCGMARATLSEGIEVSLREAVPELAGVVDVTDHSRGQNPFYEPASS